MEKDIKVTNEEKNNLVSGEVVNIMVPSLLAVPLHPSIDTQEKMQDLVNIHTSNFMVTPKLTNQAYVNDNMKKAVTLTHNLIENFKPLYIDIMNVTSALVNLFHTFKMSNMGTGDSVTSIVELTRHVLDGRVLFVVDSNDSLDTLYDMADHNELFTSFRIVSDVCTTHLDTIKDVYTMANSGFFGYLRHGMCTAVHSSLIPVLITEHHESNQKQQDENNGSVDETIKRLGLDTAEIVITLK